MIVEIDGIEFAYKSVKVLKHAKFTVDKGEIVAVLGPNGSGKTTLLRCMARILKPQRGAILIEGVNMRELKSIDVAKKVGYVPQNHNGSYMTVFDALLLGRRPHIRWSVGERDLKKVSEMIGLLGLEEHALKLTNELSGGELQKVIIGRALVQEPRVLLLDEPTNNLDPKNQVEIMGIIRKISKERGLASVVVLHDLNLALRFADKFLMLKDGEIFAQGGREITTPENIREVYGIEAEIVKYKGIPVVIPVYNSA